MSAGRKHRSSYKTYARRNLVYRFRFPLGIAAVVLLAAACVGIVFLVRAFLNRNDGDTVSYETMRQSSLATVEFGFGGYRVNLLHGYTEDIDIHYVHRDIYVLRDTYDIDIYVNGYGSDINSVTFKLKDAEADSLIQTGEAKMDTASEEGTASGSITIDNIIEDGREYILDIEVSSSGAEDAHYYTRIKRDSSAPVDEQLETALLFNSCLFNIGDEEAEDYIVSFLQSNYLKNDNTDFGDISIYSSTSAISWDDMNVQMTGDPYIEILDVDGEIGYFRLNYTVTRTEKDEEEYYRVSEYYRIRVTDSYVRVLDYERETDQIFDPSADGVVMTKSAALGILSDGNTDMMCSSDGNLSCFVVNDTLWAMDTEEKTIRKIFSFSHGVDDVRGNYDQHDVRIVRVSDSGDIQFIAYGYMNAGLHEGRVGVGMYTYRADEDKVKEEVFIPCGIPYEILKNYVGGLFYLSDSGDLYLTVEESLYRLNAESEEAELITDGLTEGAYIIHPEGMMIAWQNDGKINDAETITVLNMNTEEMYEVSAPEGKAIKALGFLNTDFVYGQAETGNIYEDTSGALYLLMTEMFVVNSSHEVQTRADSGSAYYISAENEYNRIVLKTALLTEDGLDASDDYTLFATGAGTYASMQTYTEYDDVKRTIHYIEFPSSTTSAGTLTVDANTAVMFTDGKTADILSAVDTGGRYYVYAAGEVILASDDAAESVRLAYDESGMVLAADGTLFYKRSVLPSSIELTETALQAAYESTAAGQFINVTGITLEEAMYFTGSRIPIVWERDDGTYIFFGYDVSDNITMYNAETREKSVSSWESIEDLFETEGRVYVLSDED